MSPERIMMDSERCQICGWPLVKKTSEGCTRESCSMRPRPKPTYSESKSVLRELEEMKLNYQGALEDCTELETRLSDVKQANRMANDLLEQALAELKAVTAERDGAREMMEQARRELRDLEAELRFLKQECGS